MRPHRLPVAALLLFALSVPAAVAQMPDIEWARGGHVGEVTGVAVLPDSRTAVSAGLDATIRLWDLASHRMLRTIPTGGIGIRGLAVAHGGSVAAVADIDGRVRLYRIGDWSLLRTLGVDASTACNDVAVTADGAIVAVAYADGVARIYATADGALLRELVGHPSQINAVDITRDGSLVATAGDDYTVRIWNRETGAVVRTFQEVQYAAPAVAFSPDGTRFACVGMPEFEQPLVNRAVVVASVATGDVTARVHGDPNTEVTSIAFSDDGRYLASTSKDFEVPGSILQYTLAISDLTGVKSVWTYQQSNADRWINDVAFVPDGSSLVAGNPTGAVRVLSLLPDDPARIATAAPAFVSSHLAPVRALVRLPVGIVSGSNDGWLIRHDGEGVRRDSVRAHASGIRSIAATSDGARIATGGEDGAVKIWTAAGLAQQRVLYLSAEWPVVAVEFLSDGRLLAAIGGADTVVVLLDSASSDPLRTYRGNVAQIRSMDVAPDESHFATGAEDGSVRIFRLAEEIPVASVAAHTGTVTALAFARDGRTIHSGDGRGSLATVDVAQAAVTDLRDAHAGAINGIAISDDGRYMVTASSDSTLRLWGFDAENYTELTAFAYPSDQLDVQLDLPSNRIYSSTADGSVIGWRFRTVSSAGAGDADARAVSIAPRPARDAAVLTLATRSIGTVGVELIDMLGTRVWSHRTNGPTTAIQLDLSGISPGLYFVRVTLENGAVVCDVLVVR